MKKAEANRLLKQIFAELDAECESIKEQAKKDGTWMPGLDSNKGLYKDAEERAKAKAKALWEQIEDK